jgi:hypothetical protein
LFLLVAMIVFFREIQKETRRGSPDEEWHVKRNGQFEFISLPFTVGDLNTLTTQIFQMSVQDGRSNWIFDTGLINA